MSGIFFTDPPRQWLSNFEEQATRLLFIGLEDDRACEQTSTTPSKGGLHRPLRRSLMPQLPFVRWSLWYSLNF